MVETSKKIIVIGKGFLGSRIAKHFNFAVYDKDVVNLLDCKQIQTFLNVIKPDIVINATGITGRPNIDWCEAYIDNEMETIQGNVIAPINLAIETEKRDIHLIHFSSGCIYEGNNNEKGWSEIDTSNFTNSLYSRTKAYSENILNNETSALILRLRMPIDDIPDPRNLINKLRSYDYVVNTQNSMTTIPSLLFALSQLINKQAKGIYNIVNPGTISPVEIMLMYKEIVDNTHTFNIIDENKLKEICLTGRSNCMLNTDKLKNEEIHLPEIHVAIKECLIHYKMYEKK